MDLSQRFNNRFECRIYCNPDYQSWANIFPCNCCCNTWCRNISILSLDRVWFYGTYSGYVHTYIHIAPGAIATDGRRIAGGLS